MPERLPASGYVAAFMVCHTAVENPRGALPRFLHRHLQRGADVCDQGDGLLLTTLYGALGLRTAARALREMDMRFDSWEDGSPHFDLSPAFHSDVVEVRVEVGGTLAGIEALLRAAGIRAPGVRA